MHWPSWATKSLVLVLVVSFSVLLFLVGLGGYGLWEPWEVDRIDHLLDAQDTAGNAEVPENINESQHLAGRLTQMVLAGTPDEFSLRLPHAIVALGTLLLVFLLTAALFGAKPAAFTALILAGTPAFFSTGRLLVWTAFPLLSHCLVFAGAGVIVGGRFRAKTNAGLGLLAVAAGLALGFQTSGFLLGLVAPVFGVTLGLTLVRAWTEGKAATTCWGLLLAITVVVLFITVQGDLLAIDRTRGDPTFVVVLRRTLLGCFPWTGAMIVGLVVLAGHGRDVERRSRGVGVLISGLAVSFVFQTLWYQEDGGPLPALWTLALGVGLLLTDVDNEGKSHRIAAAVSGLFLLLGLRDHILEPGVALAALGADEVDFPEIEGSKAWFVFITVLTGLPLILALVRGSEKSKSGVISWLKANFGWLQGQLIKKIPSRWFIVGALTLLFFNGVLGVLAPDILWFSTLSCLERRIWLVIGCLIPAIVLLALLGKLLWDGTVLLGRWKGTCVVVAGALSAMLQIHIALPRISLHLSSRNVVRTYEQLARNGEELLAFRTSAQSSEIVGGPSAEDVTSVESLIKRLEGQEKVFALIRSEDLPQIDVRFRKNTSHHLPVADMSNSSTYLITSRLPEKLDRNPLRAIVLSRRPSPSSTITANYEDHIELIGVDVEGPNGRDTVCPMDVFTLRFYWHCLKTIPGSKKIFVHIDGYGQRINGDHEPADGQFPVKYWRPGDYVVDEMKLRVPMHFSPGNYSIFVGFFQGSKRMDVIDGPSSRDDRVKAGVLKVR